MARMLHTVVVLFLLLNLAGALVRVLLGPAAADRMLAAQLLGTNGVAILVLLAHAAEEPALRDAALVLALLAVLIVFAFSRRERDGGRVAR
jgi:multicomponent Na+:H+ antiporter subunit F